MSPAADSTAPNTVQADVLYSLREFKLRTGFGNHAMRTARRNGLKVRYVGGRAFVKGKDFFDYLERLEVERQ